LQEVTSQDESFTPDISGYIREWVKVHVQDRQKFLKGGADIGHNVGGCAATNLLSTQETMQSAGK